MSILSLQEVTYNAHHTQILKGISLDIQQGECLSIIGASGSGKSTLLKLCADLITQSGGEIYFHGKKYSQYDPINLRKKISYCIQLPHLFGKSVWDNLAFPFEIRKEVVCRKRIISLLECFNMDEHFLEKDIRLLSGGEKQRIAIIRNLMYTPEVLLLDEATASLDEGNGRVVEAYVKSLNEQGVTVLWVTHNLIQSEGIFNKRLTLADGKIYKMEELKR